MDIEEIKFNYSRMDTYKLIKLANQIETIREDVIPLLKAELKSRNELESVSKIDKYLNFNQKENLSFEELVDVDLYVSERLAMGEAMESIVNDLKSRGVDLLDRTIKSSLRQDNMINEIIEEVSQDSTEEHLRDKYAMNDDEVNHIQQKVKLKARNNIRLGALLIVVALLLLLLGGYNSCLLYTSDAADD